MAVKSNGKPGKRIVICADGTWNDPEDEHPTNVLRMARAIRPQVPTGALVDESVRMRIEEGDYDPKPLRGWLEDQGDRRADDFVS